MTRQPTTTLGQAVIEALDRLKALRTKPDIGGLSSPLVDLERRIRELVPRVESPDPNPDGWPASTNGSGRGGAILTRVEAAANARIGIEVDPVTGDTYQRRPIRNPVTEIGLRVFARILRVGPELDAIIRDLDTIDRISSPDDPVAVDPDGCECCARALAHPRRSTTKGTVGGRLPAVTRLCWPCRYYIEDNGAEPTVEQLLQHDLTGKWKIRIDPRL